MELLDEDDNVQEVSNTKDEQNYSDPIATLLNDTSNERVYILRAKNDTGNSMGSDGGRGVAMHFGYVIEEV